MFINFLDHTSALFTAMACALVLAAAAPGVLAQQPAGDTLEDTVWVTEGGPIGGALVFELQRGGVFRSPWTQHEAGSTNFGRY